MATGTFELHPLQMIGDPTNPPGLLYTALNRPYLTFLNTAITSGIYLLPQLPTDYASDLVADIMWSGSASTTVTDSIQWTVYVMAYTPDTDSVSGITDSFDTENVAADDILGTTAVRIQTLSIALSNDDLAVAGDYLVLRVLRDFNDAADDLAETAYFWGGALRWTTT